MKSLDELKQLGLLLQKLSADVNVPDWKWLVMEVGSLVASAKVEAGEPVEWLPKIRRAKQAAQMARRELESELNADFPDREVVKARHETLRIMEAAQLLGTAMESAAAYYRGRIWQGAVLTVIIGVLTSIFCLFVPLFGVLIVVIIGVIILAESLWRMELRRRPLKIKMAANLNAARRSLEKFG